jgi:hypothetical protein
MSSRIRKKAALRAKREAQVKDYSGATATGPVLHMKKFMGGRMTPEEVHRALGFRKSCAICRGPPAIRIRVFAPLKEVMARTPEFLGEIMAANPAGPTAPLPTMPSKYGLLLKLSDQAFCDTCKVGAERAAAHPPKRWPFKDCQIVEIDRGPPKQGPVVQVLAKLGL